MTADFKNLILTTTLGGVYMIIRISAGFGCMVLNEKSLSLLNSEQRYWVNTHWELNQQYDLVRDIILTPDRDVVLKELIVRRGVWDPIYVKNHYHSEYMFHHNGLFYGKTAIDIGCGTGITGIVMAKFRANRVVMSDISEPAVRNASENVSLYELGNAEVVKGDLFENIDGRADCITFMHPCFPGSPPKGDTIAASMLADPELIERFLSEAPKYLADGGVIVMPSFSLAGDLNNPAVVGKKYGFDVKTTFMADSTTGLQQGRISMHELRLR